MMWSKFSAFSRGLFLFFLFFSIFHFSVVTAAESAKFIEAQEFRLVAKDGTIAAELKLTESGPVLIVYNGGAPNVINLAEAVNRQKPEPTLAEQAKKLLAGHDYKGVIALLTRPALNKPSDFQLNLLLSRAEIENCELLATQGDNSYKSSLEAIYLRGQQLYSMNPSHPEPYYIVSKSLYLNGKTAKAYDVVKKAVYYSPNDPSFLALQGDICLKLASLAHGEDFELQSSENMYAEKALDAYQKAQTLSKDNAFLLDMLTEKIEKARKMKINSGY